MNEYIQKIVKLGKQEDMECLSEIMVNLLYDLKETNYREYIEYKHTIMGMAFDYKVDKELAQELVEDFKPLGEYWSMETIANNVNIGNHRLEDMYVVMNSLANDYQSIIPLDDVETYTKMAYAWLDDVDAHENKLWKYFVEN